MDIALLLNDRSVKPKEKTKMLSSRILDGKITVDELMQFAKTAKDSQKATCIESLEFATKQKPTVLGEEGFRFVTSALTAKAPRIKWESAKVIGNTAHLFSDKSDDAITNLLDNSAHEGTVVRWSAALALGEILKLKTKHNNELLTVIQAIADKEENNGVKKVYLDAIRKTKK